MMAAAGPSSRVSVTNLRKSFDGGPVLHDVSLELRAGETRALLGENGSGKSTLVKILSGVYELDSGELLMEGRALDPPTIRQHVTVIHQDLGLAPEMSVFDNIAVGVGFGGAPFSHIRFRSVRQRIRSVLTGIGSDLDLDARVDTLTAPDRTVVAVARAILRLGETGIENALFILDEPTAVATGEQAATLMNLMREMALAGAAVLFITHRIAEAMVADRVTVLRDGEIVLDARSAGLDEIAVIDAMLGRRLETYYPDKLPPTPGAGTLLSARGLRGQVLDGIDLDLHAGDIVGVTGIGGMGQDELPQLLCAAAPRRAGTVVVDGKQVATYDEALAAGVAYVPSNRRRDGGWISGTAKENISLPVLQTLAKRGWINAQRERDLAAKVMARTQVRPLEPEKLFGSFSGGNQQKIVVGKWLQRAPRVLLLHEPTQGVDVGARRDLLQLVSETAQSGSAVLVSSNDFDQLAEICQRVIVLYDGRVVDELVGDLVSEGDIAKSAQRIKDHH
jgi:ribose transport system ATP-binding protein